ncbi:MAG: guanylate kinase [Firmicutes bacterium HGW-Firmicutes-9]|jgi:guanylate kinase|nr:MAG: guanylate kinase [Firmicutes bacterium HGW-Firmicutes-9]
MKQTRRGLLLVVSGPAGVGKGTINLSLISRNSDIRMSVSATTRSPRPGEIDGVHYFFKTDAEFQKMIESGAFLEYMRVFNTHYYGTPKSFVEQELAEGRSVILEIDVQGAMRVKAAYPDAVLIFIAPPSMSELKSRLIHRGTESTEAIERRFETAFQEMELVDRYDYVVVNDILDLAIARTEDIIVAERCRVSRNGELIEKLKGGRSAL